MKIKSSSWAGSVPVGVLIVMGLIGCGSGGGPKSGDSATPSPRAGGTSSPSPSPSTVTPTPAPSTVTPTPVPVPTPSAVPTPVPTPKLPTPSPKPTPSAPVFTIAAQFNPRDYAASGISGGLVAASGDTYTFDTSAASGPTLTDTTTGTVIATGRYVTQTFSTDRKSVTYAVFAFSGDIHIGGKCVFTGRGKNPLVLLSQGDITLDEEAILDVSADGTIEGSLTYPQTTIPGPGGGGPDEGPGVGGTSSNGNGSGIDYYYGGSGFGGRGGMPSVTYGDDFSGGIGVRPHLQGGSGGRSVYTTGGPGGGAVYLAALDTLTIHNAHIKALGGHGNTGGSGGGVALFAGKKVTFSTETLVADASGGSAGLAPGAPFKPGEGHIYGGGGGGRVVVGYPVGTDSPGIGSVAIGGNGVGNIDGMRNGAMGVLTIGPFAGF